MNTLVNSAGIAISSPMQSAMADWLQEWDTTIAVNLRAPAVLSKLAIGHSDDVAPFVAFLASGLGDHSTGCTIDVNAGSYVH